MARRGKPGEHATRRIDEHPFVLTPTQATPPVLREAVGGAAARSRIASEMTHAVVCATGRSLQNGNGAAAASAVMAASAELDHPHGRY
jgi:hypothetical protein